MGNIVGRNEEVRVLEQLFASNNPEFLAVYGRRRVGKTFLIRTFFESKKALFFNVTGTLNGALSEQVKNFTRQIANVFYNKAKLQRGKNWHETFQILTDAIEASKERKIVLFFDEFPWLATKNSRLIQQLDYYWNQYWSRDSRIKLIICGSSASWIIDKIVNNKGGLHNRLTHSICLESFKLREAKQYLNHLGIKLTNKHILEIYMATGGVPYYLSKIEKGLSSSQNIENLAFKYKSFLLEEFDNLFSSLFKNSDDYIDVLRKIAQKRGGLGQEELMKQLDKSLRGKKGIKVLQALKDAGFIIGFKPYGHEKKGINYKVIDEYTLFYFRWIEPVKSSLLERGLVKGYWEKNQDSPAWYSWAGYTFESICYKHLAEINIALNLSPSAIPTTWRYVPRKGREEQGAQIDLLFVRDDDAITVCEIKYTREPFVIDKKYAENLRRKIEVFKGKTKTTKQIFLSFISANGIKSSLYSEEMVDSVAILEDLF